MAAAPPIEYDKLTADFHLVMRDTTLGITIACVQSHFNLWKLLCQFYQHLNANLFLVDCEDPILLLQLFALCYCKGESSASGSPTKKHQVEQALHSIGQTLAGMGNPLLAPFSSNLNFVCNDN